MLRTPRLTPAAPAARSHQTLRRLRAALWRHRLLVGAFALFLAARILLPLLVPSSAEGTTVLVAVRTLPAGSSIGAADVTPLDLGSHLNGDGFFTRAEQATGRRLAVAIPAGTPLSAGLLADGVASTAVPAGKVVIPVRFTDQSIAHLLQPGQRIEVLAGVGGSEETFTPARTLATSALVMSTSPDQAGGLLASDGGSVALLAVSPHEARLISGATAWATISAAWVE